MTDPDSEAVTPDGSTLVVDSQQDSELALIKNPGAYQTVSYLPLTLAGALTAVDDTRYVESSVTFMLFTDTPKNYVYRVDGAFATGAAFSSAPTQVASLNTATGVLTPIVSGLGAPHGLIFVTAPCRERRVGHCDGRPRGSEAALACFAPLHTLGRRRRSIVF